MPSLTINGRILSVSKQISIIEAAKTAGIEIPNLCHDPRFDCRTDGSRFQGCGLCVVSVAGFSELQKACSTPAAEGMHVLTESPEVVAERRAILRRILLTHPNDCMTCPKSGGCSLQDLCFKYGITHPAPENVHRTAETDISNSFFYADPDKCISCGKCVEMCATVQCTEALSFRETPSGLRISPPDGRRFEDSACVSCGNCVSICPVGALMPKQNIRFRYWETRAIRTTCPYCGVGCQMDLRVKDNTVVEIHPAEGPSNTGLLCVKGRFAFDFVSHPDRLKHPLIRKNGRLQPCSWEEALSRVADRLTQTSRAYGPDSIAFFSSARALTEENYLLSKFARAVIGTNNIDHCARL